MRTQIILFSLIWLFLSGCTSAHLIKHKPDSIILKAVAPGVGEIILKNGKTYEGFNIQIARDSTFWSDKVITESVLTNFNNKKIHRIQNSEISKIIILKSNHCALAGYGVGALLGIAIGALIGLTSDSNSLQSGILLSGLVSQVTGLIGMISSNFIYQQEFNFEEVKEITSEKGRKRAN